MALDIERRAIFSKRSFSGSSFRDDYYVFEKEKHRLVGKDTKKSFMLGDKLEIRVKNVKIAERQVDFSPVKYQSA